MPYECCVAVQTRIAAAAATATAATDNTIASQRGIELIRFNQLLLHGNPRCYKIKEEEEKEKRNKAKKRRNVRLKPYFSIITTAVASLTILLVFDGMTVYHAIISSHYMPLCDDCCVLCRDMCCKIKVDKEK